MQVCYLGHGWKYVWLTRKKVGFCYPSVTILPGQPQHVWMFWSINVLTTASISSSPCCNCMCECKNWCDLGMEHPSEHVFGLIRVVIRARDFYFSWPSTLSTSCSLSIMCLKTLSHCVPITGIKVRILDFLKLHWKWGLWYRERPGASPHTNPPVSQKCGNITKEGDRFTLYIAEKMPQFE